MFKFLNNYTIGIDIIDEEHLEIIKIANKLYDALITSSSLVFADKLFISFATKTAEHFKNEESYMKSINYPLFEEHFEEHENITNEMLDVLFNNKKDLSTYDAMLTVVNDSILNHMAEEDVKIKYFLEC
jgi:hemerythrin